MARKFLTNLDMSLNQLKNALMDIIAGNPSTPTEGQLWYNSTTQAPNFANHAGTPVDVLARGTHTGTQTANTISDFDAQVRTSRLDQMAVPLSDVSVNGHRLTGVADPLNPQDVSTKNYVDTALATSSAGTTYKASVRLATTANDTLSGLSVRDGVTPVAGDRVLVKNQTTASANGIYIASSGAWTRAADADSSADLQGGAVVPVDEGTANHDTMWMLTTDVTTLGTDSVTFTQFGAGAVLTAGNGIDATALAGNQIAVKASTGISVGAGGVAVDPTVVAKKFTGSFTGNGTTTSFPVTHNLANIAPLWSVYNGTQQYDLEFQPANGNSGSFVAATAPAAGTYTYTIIG